jgi:hypothetical protein|tara:strand:+ start:116 stop:862 length:747 start_codon:yes stop_codon:yes gene_type:complete
MIRVQKTQKGFALVTSLLLLLLMTVMGIAMTARSNLNTNMSVEYSRSEHVFFAAEAGIEHARRYLENESSQNKYSGNINGPINSEPDNRCLADYKDGIGLNQYDTLGKDNGKFAYKFPPAISGTTMQVDSACAAINANATIDKNYRRMDCELDLDNDPNTNDDEKNYFKTFGFSYFIFYEGESSDTVSRTSTGTGQVGTSTEYGADQQDIAYYYKVISCGAGFEWNGESKDANLKQIQTLEARIKLEK